MVKIASCKFKHPRYKEHHFNHQRGSSAPYITGDTFRHFADFNFDEAAILFPYTEVKPGQIIFVQSWYARIFFPCIHPLIKVPYVLITHRSDHSMPGNYSSYLEDKKILSWFTNNPDIKHPKLYPLPMGIVNKCWLHGDVTILEKKRAEKKKRANLLLMNFLIDSCSEERGVVYKHFKTKSFCTVKKQKDFESYLDDLLRSKFVLSPRGIGLDCHRTWESLLMGAYPIVKTSLLDPLFEDLPVVIVQNWSEVTEDFLNKTYALFQNTVFNYNKLMIDYWMYKIKKSVGETLF